MAMKNLTNRMILTTPMSAGRTAMGWDFVRQNRPLAFLSYRTGLEGLVGSEPDGRGVDATNSGHRVTLRAGRLARPRISAPTPMAIPQSGMLKPPACWGV